MSANKSSSSTHETHLDMLVADEYLIHPLLTEEIIFQIVWIGATPSGRGGIHPF